MNNLIRYVPIALIAGYFLYNNFASDSSDLVANDIDLNQVLDITVETIYAFEESHPELVGTEESNADGAFFQFSEDLAANYNAAVPALHEGKQIGVVPQEDASLIAFEDNNANNNFDEGEDALYLIEVDGENSRVIATSRSGAVNDSRISGTGLLTGMLIGSMLSRQRASGANPSAKKTQTAKQAQSARSRSGSGSHSRGK